jgi:hypothetical protein
MRRTLAALSANQDLKSALEDAAGAQLPTQGWKQKVAIALEANPELKDAVTKAEKELVVDESELACRHSQIKNPFSSNKPCQKKKCRKTRCICYLVLVFFLFFVLLTSHHHHGEDDQQEPPPPPPQDGEDREDDHDHPSPFFAIFFWLCVLGCVVSLCRVCMKRRSPPPPVTPAQVETPAVAVDIESMPTIVSADVKNGTVTSVTMKYIDMEKGTLKGDVKL